MNIKHIIEELKEHAPFTFLGSLTGIAIMFLSRNMPESAAYNLFYISHPAHVFIGALTTSAMYQRYKRGSGSKKFNLLRLFAVGFAASIGVATLSDSLIPYIAEILLNMPARELHIGFLEKWWIVNPIAAIGIAIAFYKPVTKVPHFVHILLSTWASLFHVMMAQSGALGWGSYILVLIFLFLAVWIPCCFSDIVFPLLFIKPEKPRS